MQYYSLAEAAKATGKDKRTIKSHREQGRLAGEPVMENGRLAGWQFDPAELARVYSEFKPLEQLDAETLLLPPATGDKDPGNAGTSGGATGEASPDILVSYQARMAELGEAKIRLEGDKDRLESELAQARRETREERDKAEKERARLHGIIEGHTRLLTHERDRAAGQGQAAAVGPWRQYGVPALLTVLMFLAGMAAFALVG